MQRLAVGAVMALVLSGCFGAAPTATDGPAPAPGLVPVQERHREPYNVTGYYSHTLKAGPYSMKDPLSVFVPVALPAEELGAAVDPLNPPSVHLGLFLPDVPEGTTVPVIADIGPYYGDSDLAATDPKTRRLGGFLIENFVPHGYAVAQVSVFGSGLSNHCMDLMGHAEQLGVDAAVTWLGSQSWSNGNVGLIGRSYDGSTPWQAAAFGNPHLATIVPISGLIGMHDLMWRNGTAETRGPVMHNVVYGQFGIDVEPEPGSSENPASQYEYITENLQTVCPDYVLGPAEGAAAYATGGNLAAPGNSYWTERTFFERALANYKGSVYFIHGLQDWNVDPHMAFPAYGQLEAAGLDVKGLFGQWAHMYPDRPSEHVSLPAGRGKEAYPATVRYDWAQDLLEWFDHYLMETGPTPQLHVEVQDNRGTWRITSTYPPADRTANEFSLWNDLEQVQEGGLIAPANVVQPTDGFSSQNALVFTSAPLESDVRLAGLHQLHLDVTPLGAGGQLFAELHEVSGEGGLRLGHAIMDLRYAAGGTTLRPVVPGMPLAVRMEFEAFDAFVHAGSTLRLTLQATGEDYLPSATPAAVQIDAGTLRLFATAPDVSAFFTPPAWSGEAQATAPQP